MTIDDCEMVSKEISPILDVSELLSESYRLEVSSPGIDRPLVRPSDFEHWAGHEAKIELKEPIDGRRRFRGRLEGFEDGEIRMLVDLGEAGGQKVIGLAIGLVASARLVFTDELVREALSRAKRKSKTSLGDGSEAGPIDVEDS
jgi:ribosome maturation factor RimP